MDQKQWFDMFFCFNMKIWNEWLELTLKLNFSKQYELEFVSCSIFFCLGCYSVMLTQEDASVNWKQKHIIMYLKKIWL